MIIKQKVIISIIAICGSISLSGCTSTLDNIIDNTTGKCYYDYDFNESYYAGYYFVAPEGYKYIITTIVIKNDAEHWVSTNPNYWKLVANGIEYPHDAATYDEGITHQTVKIYQNANFTTEIVYQIPENVALTSCRIMPTENSLTGFVDFIRDDNLL